MAQFKARMSIAFSDHKRSFSLLLAEIENRIISHENPHNLFRYKSQEEISDEIDTLSSGFLSFYEQFAIIKNCSENPEEIYGKAKQEDLR